MIFFSPLPTSTQRGFSLIELMVTISIVVIVTGIALVRYTSFNSALLLTNQAYEIALDVRQAQVFGVSVNAQDVGESQNRNPIGVAFSTTETPVLDEPSTQSYVLFLDFIDPVSDEDGQYVSDEDTSIDQFGLDSRFTIANLAAGDDSSSMANCDTLTITFKRPDFDARIVCGVAGNSPTTELQGEITISGVIDPSVTNKVVVRDNGQISVQQ